MLAALKDKLLRQDLFEEFTREMNRLRMEHRAGRVAAEEGSSASSTTSAG